MDESRSPGLQLPSRSPDEWCDEKGFALSEAAWPVIADFLKSPYSTRAALSPRPEATGMPLRTAAKVFAGGSGVADASELGRLPRSLFLKRPTHIPLAPAWSLPKVLDLSATSPRTSEGGLLHHRTAKTVPG